MNYTGHLPNSCIFQKSFSPPPPFTTHHSLLTTHYSLFTIHLSPFTIFAILPFLFCPVPSAQNPEPRTQYPEPRTQNPEPRTQNPEPRTQYPEPSTQNPEPRTQYPVPIYLSPLTIFPLGSSLTNTSQITIPAATEIFSECFVPYWGISTQSSKKGIRHSSSPLTSFPKTRAYFFSLSG